MKLPCLVIAFRRVVSLRNLFDSLNPDDISILYLAIDGPKLPSDVVAQKEIVNTAISFGQRHQIKVEILQQKSNLGVAVGVISAIDWFFEHEMTGVILEDDLVVSPRFMKFMQQALPLIEETDKALLASGSQFINHVCGATTTNWTNYPLIWGWGTSALKWKVLRKGLENALSASWQFQFDKVKNFWAVGAYRVGKGGIDTWDIPLAWYMVQSGNLCLLSSVNLVSNLGFGEDAVHTKLNVFPMGLPFDECENCTSKIGDIRSSDIANVNLFLESYVFKVKKRHRFLSLYGYFRDLIFIDRSQSLNLSYRIRELPDSRSHREDPSD